MKQNHCSFIPKNVTDITQQIGMYFGDNVAF